MVKVIFLLLAASGLLLGDDTGRQSRNYVVNNFQTAIANPMTSDSSFVTMDGRKRFQANLTCSNSARSFLEISYSGSSDIAISVLFDKDLDGSKESSFSFSGISGVAANGVIKCDSNSWNNCRYYSFIYNGTSLSLQEVSRNNIGGAYCINSSCGSLAVSQKVETLNALGGAISNVISSYHSSYLVTRTLNDGIKIEYYGQSYTDCSNLSAYGTANIPYNERGGDLVIRQRLDTTLPNNVVYNNTVNNAQRQTASTELRSSFSSFKQTNQQLANTLTLNDDLTFAYTTEGRNGDGALVGDNLINAKYCQITKPIESAVVYSDGNNRANSTTNTTTYKDFIVECIGDNFDICPVGAGEILKYDCGQIDNFGEVTSALSSINEATKDFACSTR
ncbi:MAG: hypothetical protein AABY36_08210 [Campylobacterota bacterium]